MELGPKLIMGDLNGNLAAFPTALALIKEHGWTDIGNDDHKCQGKPGRTTCYTKEEAKESRIDFVLANNRMTPAIVRCHVDESSDYEVAKVQRQGTAKTHQLFQPDGTNNRSRVGQGGQGKT